MIRLLIVLTFFYSSSLIFAQAKLLYPIFTERIDKERIDSKVVLDMLEKFEQEEINHFQPSTRNPECNANYAKANDDYLINRPISDVWKAYTQTHPAQGWKLKSSRFILMNDPYYSRYVYSGDNISGQNFLYQIGQTFFLELKLYIYPIEGINLGIKVQTIPVALMVSGIEDELECYKKFEISYIRGNESSGKQVIEFYGQGNKTEIKHTSYYNKSPRNEKHYEYFHKQLVDKFHAHFKQMIEGSYE
ncbi:hypothetical protein N9N67_09420 [Bacteriovoracaceae bacterium]|nr:hypothetical protein [Bacteriovoracaceae bacterium]